MPIAKKRVYNSESRQIKAQETKEYIISSAQKLFESKGFENVTIEEIAQHASVSTPTIYALFRSKIGVLRALIDKALPPEHYEALVRKAVTSISPAQHLAMSAAIARQIYDAEQAQLGFLQSASILDAELKKLELDREERRYRRQEPSFRKFIDMGVLAPQLDVSKAQDILWAFTGRDLYRMLVIERGWTSDEYEQWLAQALEKMLLK